MLRRFWCGVCALVLVLSLPVSASAADAPKPAKPEVLERPALTMQPSIAGTRPLAAIVSPLVADETPPGAFRNWRTAPFNDTLTEVTDEVDYYPVYMEVGEEWLFDLDATGVDYDLLMFDPSSQIAANSSGTGTNEQVGGVADVEGWWFLGVYHWAGAGTGAYILDGTFASPDDDIYTSPIWMTPGLSTGNASGSFTCFLESNSEWDDVRRIWLWPGDSVSLSLTKGAGNTSFNPSLHLYGPAATTVWGSPAITYVNAGAFPRVINHAATTAGYHYADIYCAPGSASFGEATLTWNANFNLVYRFYNPRNGTHFYTATEAEKANVIATLGHVYQYEGSSYRVDPVLNTETIWRFYKPSTGTHFYTADPAEKANVQANMSHIYSLDGAAYKVLRSPAPGAMPVWRYYKPSTGTHLYTADAGEKANIDAHLSHLYSYDGVAFYVVTGY